MSFHSFTTPISSCNMCVLTHTLFDLFSLLICCGIFVFCFVSVCVCVCVRFCSLFVCVFWLLFLDLKLCHITAIRFEIENICTVHVHFFYAHARPRAFNSLSRARSRTLTKNFILARARVLRIKLHLSYSTIVYTSNRIEKKIREIERPLSRYYKLQLPNQLPCIFIC